MTKRLYSGFTALFVCLLAIFTAAPASASHLRGTSLSWAPTSTHGQVTFTLQYSQRTSAAGYCYSSAHVYTNGICALGDTVNVAVSFGDGQSASEWVTITSVNASQDWFSAVGTFTHTYSGNGPYTAAWNECCRLSNLVSGENATLQMSTTVMPNAGNHSPVVSMPAVISVPLQSTSKFTVFASDLDHDPLQYRLATASEMYATSGFNCAANQPPGVSIDANTGVVTWDTTQITQASGCRYAAPKVGDLWPVQFMVQDLDSSGNVKSKVPLDVILEFVSNTEPLPTLSLSQTSFSVKPGTPVTFTATGDDPGATNARITMTATGFPVGATATNLNAAVVPPTSSVFSWTPTAAQAGTSYTITFTATNDTFEQVNQSASIFVQNLLPPVLSCPALLSNQYGNALLLTPSVTDPQGETVTLSATYDGGQLQTGTAAAATAAQSVSFTFPSGNAGTHTIVVTATDTDNQTSSCTVPVAITQASKTLSFLQPASPLPVNSEDTLVATATGGDPVVFTVTGGAAGINGNAITYTNAGPVTITATSPASTNYTDAAPVSYVVNVTPAAAAYTAGNLPVGSTGTAQIATINFTTGGTLGSVAALTQGAANLDFNIVPGGTCVIGQAYTAGQACTVEYTFTPMSPGSRFGALTVMDVSANVLGTSYVSGTGIGPLGLFTSTEKTLGITGLRTPRGLSTDGAGNVYVLESSNGNVDKVAKGSNSVTVIERLPNTGSGGTAIDGAGNLFVNSTGDRTIYEFVNGQAPAVAIANTCGGDDNIETDGAGNLYFTCYTSNTGAIMKVDAVTHAVTQLVPGNMGHRFVAMTVDVAGNVFAPDFNTNTLYELAAGASNLVPVVSNDGNLNNPHGIALDPAGNIYVTNYSGSNRNILRYAAGTYAFTSLPAAGSRGVVIDGSGNLYSIPDDGSIAAFSRTVAPPITFSNVPVGSTGNSLQTVEYENDGNAPLVISSYSAALPFSVTGAGNTCAAESLSSGASCFIGATFSPVTVGAQNGTVVLTSNNNNVANSNQSVPLSATAIPGSQSITFAPISAVTYGVAPIALNATGGASGNPVTFSVISGPGAVSGNMLTITGAGTLTVAANQAASSTYNAAPQVTRQVMVSRAALSVAIVGTPAKAYDGITAATLAPANFQVNGLVNGDVVTVNQTAGTYASANAGAQTVSATLGAASFVAASGSTANYTLPASATGNGQINVANATVTPAAATKVYGTADPALSGTLSGFVAADGITATYKRAAGETVTGGPYSITVTLTPASALSNYNITYNTAALSITPAPANVVVTATTKTYGSADPAFTGTLTGFLGTDSVTAAYSRNPGEAVSGSPYSITATLSPASVLSNYNVTYTAAPFTINPAALNITAGNGTMTYGGAAPSITSTITGLVNGDTSAALGAVTCSAAATGTSAVGTYATSCSGALDTNYTISYTGGTVTVTAAPLSVTGASATRTYGGANPVLTGTVTGIMNGDAITATYSTDATAASPVGTYAIVPSFSGAALSNYVVTATNGTLTVTAAPLLVTPANASRSYGSMNPVLSGTVRGIQNNDPITATYSTTATTSSNVGSYAITAQLSDPANKLSNYAVTLNTGTITVVKANQTIQWVAPAAITFGTPLTAAQLNATVSVPGSDAAGTVTYSPALGTVLEAGLQTLTMNVAGTGNYNPATATVSLTVNRAQPVFANLSAPTITYHAATTQISGTLIAPTAIPAGQQVAITLNGVTQPATVGTDGTFNTTFNTASMPVAAAGYTVGFAYAGGLDFLPQTAASQLTVSYAVCYDYDTTQVKKVGSTYPITISVCDANGQNVATSKTVVTGIGWGVSGATHTPLPDAGSSNGNGTFRTTGSTFMWNLKTTDMPAGQYNVYFNISDDPTMHSAPFAVR